MANKQVWTATGRRKRSSAQVRLTSGSGKITVNGVDVNEYMPYATLVMDLKQPLVATNNESNFDIDVTVKGGGFSGQTGAIRLGITRALLLFDADADQVTLYEYTDIRYSDLPDALRQKIRKGYCIKDEEALFGFLENYSS